MSFLSYHIYYIVTCRPTKMRPSSPLTMYGKFYSQVMYANLACIPLLTFFMARQDYYKNEPPRRGSSCYTMNFYHTYLVPYFVYTTSLTIPFAVSWPISTGMVIYYMVINPFHRVRRRPWILQQYDSYVELVNSYLMKYIKPKRNILMENK